MLLDIIVSGGYHFAREHAKWFLLNDPVLYRAYRAAYYNTERKKVIA